MDGELLRPADWAEHHRLSPGNQVALRNVELEFTGTAEIQSITPCPALAEGDGQVVTGRLRTAHVEETARLHLSGGVVLEGTPIHPVWSLERNDWVPLGELSIGESLRGRSGAVTVENREMVRAGTPVYNLEVDGEHVYEVSRLGVLVHNTCPDDVISVITDLQSGRKIDLNAPLRLNANKRAGDSVRDLIAIREAPALTEVSFKT